MSSEKAQELYKALIIDHYKRPYGRLSAIPSSGHSVEKFRSCGDRITMWIETRDEVVEHIGFLGEGCSIAIASASILTKEFEKKTIEEVQRSVDQLTNYFDHVSLGRFDSTPPELNEAFEVFYSLSGFQTRVACARLSLDALGDLLKS